MINFKSTKIIELGSCAFRQPLATPGSKCNFVHGYRLEAKFYFEATSLDERNWVVDFGDLKELKKQLQNQFDHTLCIAGDDPLLDRFKELHKLGGCDLRVMPDGVGIERTAEWCYKAANAYITLRTGGRCRCTKVEVWEHELNSAIYEGPVSEEENSSCCSEQTQSLPEPQQEGPNHTAARVGNRVTEGWSDPFAGTSWGSNKPPTSLG